MNGLKRLLLLGLLAAALLLSGCIQSGTKLSSTLTAVATGADCAGSSFEPVCGADGQTYYNACYAQQSGAVVSSTGSCISGGGGGGGGSGFGYWSP